MTVRLRSASPVLCVRDIAPAAAALERLGFRMQGSAGDPPSWASIQRDAVEIMLLCGNFPDPAQDWAAYIWVDDVDALHAEAVERGAALKGPPADQPYACRQFEAVLPDGRLIAFGQSTA